MLKDNIKHFKAFTIVEVIVSLLISSIVISMAYIIFINTELYFEKIKQQNAFTIQYIDFYSILKKDIHKSNAIEVKYGELIISFDYGNVVYRFEEDFIERVSVNEEVKQFNIQVYNLDYIRLKETRLVNEIILQIQGNEVFEVNFLKHYSKQTLVNTNI